MTLDELTHIFRHQTTASEDYQPSDSLEYLVIDTASSIKQKKVHKLADLDKLVPLLEGFQLDAYFDKMPVFIKPEQIIVL
jgi:hypothetical protein